MKVAFLNCTDELNPEAGSELTCVFLDKIPGTLEFCKRLKLKDPNLYFDAYVHNGHHVNASYGYLKAGVSATVEEYTPLLNELYAVGYEQYLLIFENKDTIYDICDAVRCTKALYMAAQNDFNNASLETLNAAAKILGVKYDKVKRK